ncbi:MAG: tRNA (guanine-N7-)-methyltransferase [Clostridiales bacterium]|nr:tRNA (guanine-N7-)-methyltransferase [Clostridiales bacterium]
MRLRNIPGAKEKIEKSALVIQNASTYKGKWNKFFQNENPLHIEIGMGKGTFIKTLAKQNPMINYIGIEKYESVLIRALEKLEEEEEDIKNLFFLCMNANQLNEIFDREEVDGIYLNFSDPWPKERHAKRRLTSRQFLSIYEGLLKMKGKIFFKTDNRLLFDFSLQEVKEAGWQLEAVTYDLHHSEYAIGNVMTEYEEKFSKEGKPIHRMVISR